MPQSLFFWQIFTRQLPERNHSLDNENSLNAKKQGSDSSIIWEIQDIPDFLFVTKVTFCCNTMLLIVILVIWGTGLRCPPCYTISLSWHNDTSPAYDWSLQACTDLWLAGRGQDRHRYRPQHDTSKRPSHFLLPGFRGWARRGPSPHISRDRDQCLASVGGWHSDIIVCVLVWMILLKRTIALIKQT